MADYDAARRIFCVIDPGNETRDRITIDLSDVESACRHLGVALSSYELTQAMYDLDMAGDLVVELDVFVSWWQARLASKIDDAAMAEPAPIVRLWEHVIELDGSVCYYDYTTGDVVYALPDLIASILAAYELPDKSSMDEKLQCWFQRFDIDQSAFLDVDEWRSMLIALSLPVPPKGTVPPTMRDVAGGFGDATRITFEMLQKYWYAHAPQRVRRRLVDFPEWTETIDECGAVFYTNDRTQVIQWMPPALPAQLHVFLDKSPGATIDIKIDRLFASLDADNDISLSAKELQSLLKTLGYTDWPLGRVEAAIRALEPGYDLASKATVLAWMHSCNKKAVLGDWEEYTDESSGQVFYYNPLTQESQWEPPQVTSHLQALLDKFSSDSTVTMRDKMRRLFQQYDTDNTGSLDATELKRVCAAMGQSLDETDMQAMIRAIDTSGDGLVSLDEFQAWWLSKQAVDVQWEAQHETLSRADHVRQLCATYLKVPIPIFLASPFDSNAIPRLVQALGRVCRGKALLEALHNLDPESTHVVDPEAFVQWYLAYDTACAAQEKRRREEKRAQEAVDAWIESKDEQGKTVYINSRTNERVWEKPGIQEAMQTLLASVGGHDVRAIFRRFDEDTSGTIDAAELKHLLMALGQSVDDAQLPQILAAMDTGGDGVISLEEFTTWWVCMQRRSIASLNAQALTSQVINYHAMTKDSIRALRHLFAQFDTDHSGSIDENELKHLLARLNWSISDAERHRLMQVIDTSGDGQMDCDEFIAWWVSVHRELDIKRAAQANGHLLADAKAASATGKEDPSLLASLKAIDLSEVSFASLKDKLSDFKYRLLAPKLGDYLPDETEPEVYDAGRVRFLGTINVTAIHPIIVDTMRSLLDDVVLVTPLMLADAAQRIQKMYRAKRARRQLILTLNERYVHHIDRVTGASYYINRLTKEVRFDKPSLLGEHEILTPRTALREKHTKLALRRRRLWLERVMPTMALQGRATYRTSAFFIYDVLCNVKRRLQRGVWPALLEHDHVLAQLVVRRYPRQLKRLGPHGDYPLHYALREALPSDVIIAFLQAHDEVLSLVNATGHTPMHLLARAPKMRHSMRLLNAFLDAPRGIETCTMVTQATRLTPLHLALQHHAPRAFLLRLMTACPGAFRLRNNKFEQPLHLAVRSARKPFSLRLQIVQDCIAHGSPMEPVSENAFPLHFGLVNGVPEGMLHLLLDVQPSAVAHVYRRLLPLFLAIKKGYPPSLLMRLLEMTMTQVPAVHTSKGFNPLHYALLYRMPPSFVLQLLATCPAWANEMTIRNEYPLHVAAMYNDEMAVLKALLETAPLAARHINDAGCLPLHLAVLRGATATAKELLHACPWVLLQTIQGTKYDALLLAARVRAKWPNNKALVDLCLFPPRLAPARPKYAPLALTPYFVAANTRLSAMQTFDTLHMLDHCSTDDLEAIARKKLRGAFHKPTKEWDIAKILALMARNPLDAAVQLRSLLALNQKVCNYDEAAREACVETYDIVRTVQYTMYDFTPNARIQILGQACLNHLLPTPFAKAKYQSRVDPLYKF
ncbi:hypothetical protein SPRG_08236 [Saprolegnia parasitica CBS 223.65]|uniref:Uncharacterized protein n=1 Tax=Saprolegnia parasitica (strain CBS 223.65) TaxID=695850 RepID=A0A067C7D8_SAPPC|nr:hypothetical protein SPRG_08236 [Saprolegnia parasitica CBS 223.65]KDO26433.1 hypothetical protein SPRG_08236 [Saprolegnia parasitica CBS 223.65]|eukprot:XP_012202870.1 hypothetical protein SPRG_08236 [Saprolegnia parasitica CBS 223.65]